MQKVTLEGSPFRRANNATGVIRRHLAATADNRKRLFALPGSRAMQKVTLEGSPFRRANNATGVIRRH
ncbi:hypothetical protein, partial [Pseudomonas aeruginosa]